MEKGIFNRIRKLGVWFVAAMTILGATVAQAETDVTAKVQVVKGILNYDRVNKLSYLNISVKNISQDILFAPIKVVVDSVTPATVTVANPDGKTTDGKPYFLYSATNNQLLPQASTAAKRWNFANPSTAKFSYSLRVLAGLNTAPVANAGPDQSVYVTDTGTLDGSGSSDIDGDPLTFAWSFVALPQGSKAILAIPTSVNPYFVVDLFGTYSVQLVVNDGIANSQASNSR